MKRLVVLLVVAGIFAASTALGQSGGGTPADFDGEYSGTSEGYGNFTERAVRTYTPVIESCVFGSGDTGKCIDVTTNFRPYGLSHELDLADSRTWVELEAYTILSPSGLTQALWIWEVNVNNATIGICSQTWSRATGTGPDVIGVNIRCPIDESPLLGFGRLDVDVQNANNLGGFQYFTARLVHQDIINRTVSLDMEGTESGVLNGTVDLNNVTIDDNRTVLNVTDISITELDFWIPVLAFAGIAIFAWFRGSPLVALAGTLGVLGNLMTLGWTNTTTLVVLMLAFWLDYFIGRFRDRTETEKEGPL